MATIQTRTTPQGTTSFRVIIRLKGHPRQTATFARKTDAKRWAQSTEAAIREGRYFQTVESRRHTLAELVERYIRDVAPLRPSRMRRRQQLNWWKDQLGAYVLADLTPGRLAEQRDLLLREPRANGSKRSPATVKRYLMALSHALSVAVREWGWLDDNPMRRVTKPTEPRGRVRFLSDDEREGLLDHCRASGHPNLYCIVLLALATGMRRGEIVGLRWADVDFTRSRITLFRTKNGEVRVVPLVGVVKQALAEHRAVRRSGTDLVFPRVLGGDEGFPESAWKSAVASVALEDFRFHDLRHSAASYLAMNGASLLEVADVLGHKTLQMVRRYSHLSEAHTHGVVAAMNERIFGDGSH